MATMNFYEKQLIEEVFDMQGGCVLNFTNRTFGEFMKDVVSYDIYQKYPGRSKAKIIRAFIDEESDAYVGKLIALLIKYMYTYGLVNDENIAKVEKLNELAKLKLGLKTKVEPKVSKPIVKDTNAINYDVLKSDLIKIDQLPSKQKKGYAFEKFINKLFTTFGLDPRASYRTEHDQIDGSFILDGHTVLVEAKYKEKIIPKDDLIIFCAKLSSKSHFSKGLFITYTNVDENAINNYNNSSSRFIIMTVEELYLICKNQTSLIDVLRKKFRALDEEGIIFKHYLKL